MISPELGGKEIYKNLHWCPQDCPGNCLQPGASLAMGTAFVQAHPCSGFSCTRSIPRIKKESSPRATYEPQSCTEWPWRKSRYPGASRQAGSSGLHRRGAAAPRGLSFPPAGRARCCTLFMFLWYYPACWLPSCSPHRLNLCEVNF